MIHERYERLRKAAEVDSHAGRKAQLALNQIDDMLNNAFPAALAHGIKLDGSDPCERAAEALAQWFVASDDDIAQLAQEMANA
jgi:hypothetical protein